MKVWPYVLILALLLAMVMLSMRNRRRALADTAQRAERIRVGTRVMTTSGLYGTVTARYDDDTVQLQIAPGVEVKWALAALREPEALPPNFRRGFAGGPPGGSVNPGGTGGSDGTAIDGP